MKKEILKNLTKILKNKSKGLHDPLFIGNEKKYLAECIASGYVSSVGKFVIQFEDKIKKYTKTKFAVATNSGTSALHLILKYFKANLNDEVLLPSLTYVATINSILYCNSNPNFVDVNPQTLGVCPKKLDKYLKRISKKKKNYYINKRTGKRLKALVVVHLYGMASEIVQLRKICRKYKIILIEDAAEALGSFYNNKHLGSFGDAGVLSFNGNKTITTGSGGMIITNNKKLAKATLHLSTHAKRKSSKDHFHDEIGFNYRMSNLSAAVGCAQIEKIKNILSAKRRNFITYKKIFNKRNIIDIFKEPPNSKSNYWLITGMLKNKKNKNKLLVSLRAKGFICRSIWRPLHTLKIFKKFQKDNLDQSNKIFSKSINFPSSPSISF